MKTKRFTKSIVVAIALLLIVALGFGLTGAWYRARRQATGTMKFDKGIVIQYSGFDNEITPAEDWAPNANAVRLFTSESMLPGSTVAFDDAQINQKSGTTPFFARVKLVFDFYSTADDPATENVDESVLISPASLTAANFNVSDLLTEGADGIFTSVWTESGDGWFYYTGAGETITQFPTSATDIFVTTGVGAKYIIAGDTFGPALPANYQEGGAFKVSNDISIAQFKITLIIDTLQADATPADCGWVITAIPSPSPVSSPLTDAATVLAATASAFENKNLQVRYYDGKDYIAYQNAHDDTTGNDYYQSINYDSSYITPQGNGTNADTHTFMNTILGCGDSFSYLYCSSLSNFKSFFSAIGYTLDVNNEYALYMEIIEEDKPSDSHKEEIIYGFSGNTVTLTLNVYGRENDTWATEPGEAPEITEYTFSKNGNNIVVTSDGFIDGDDGCQYEFVVNANNVVTSVIETWKEKGSVGDPETVLTLVPGTTTYVPVE